MTVLPKGIAAISLAILLTITITSTAHASSLLGLFGGNNQTDSQNASENQNQSAWDRYRNRNTGNSNDNTSPQNSQSTTINDQDKDGLSASQEAEQKTNDTIVDTDQDGLSDLTESRWNSQRDTLFCGSECAYPDPLKKDIYIETDWMTFSDGVSAKPTPRQVELITEAFQRQGINMHIDTGQYGGGNQVQHNAEIWFSAKQDEIDLSDYKRGGNGMSAQFDAKREKVYHYMLFAERYKMMVGDQVSTSSTGMASILGTDSLIAYGTISGYVPESGRELAKAATMMHELGHNLCLTDQAWGSLPAECVFEGIDNSNARQPDSIYKDYKSIMSPKHTFKLVDYSTNPTNSPNDHNDWAALKLNVFGL